MVFSGLIPNLAGLASLSSAVATPPALSPALSLEQSRQELYRDYLTKLAASTLPNITTSGTYSHRNEHIECK